MSVTPGSGGTATVSTTTPNDRVNPTSPLIGANTLYTFVPCNIRIAGNTSQGGTVAMASGDTLVNGTQSGVENRVTWDGRAESGVRVGAGVYFYRLGEGTTTRTGRMSVLK